MTRIKIFVACAVFMHFFNPDITLSQPLLNYPTYYQLWLQSVENQARIQELQRQLGDVRIAIGGLQKDLNSIFDLQQRLQELEISNQNAIKTLLEELSKMQREIAEIRKTLSPQNE
jgi:peptidoglycan hydrolase CwlO-like protein